MHTRHDSRRQFLAVVDGAVRAAHYGQGDDARRLGLRLVESDAIVERGRLGLQTGERVWLV